MHLEKKNNYGIILGVEGNGLKVKPAVKVMVFKNLRFI